MKVIKMSYTQNIDVILFKNCNMNCLHCFQARENDISLEYIKTVPQTLYKLIREEIELKPYITNIRLSIRGGELFQDSLNDEFLDAYKRVCIFIKDKLLEEYNITTSIEFISNGIFTKIERVKNLLIDTKGELGLSYDIWGRYHTKNQLNTFFKAYESFVEDNLLNFITITLTKPSIMEYIKTNALLKFTKDNIKINYNYYLPIRNNNENLATDDDLFLFFKYLVDNSIFTCTYINEFLNNLLDQTRNVSRHCNCKNIISFYNNKIYRACHVDEHEEHLYSFYGKDTENINKKDAIKLTEEKGLLKRGCIFCDNFLHCEQYCWMVLVHKDYIISQCPHKRIKEYVLQNKHILDNFIKWKN